MTTSDPAGTVALVTGGSRNIGRAISRRLAADGARVALTFHADEEGADETVRMIARAGGEARAFACALEAPHAPEELYASVRAALGPVDVLVNSAAVRPRHSLGTITAEDFDSVLALNVRAGVLLAQACIPAMTDAQFGRIVFLGGLSAYVGGLSSLATMASKMAVVGAARSLALELAESGITVNVVVPGRIETVRAHSEDYPPIEALVARIPEHRLGRSEEVADLCAFLASRSSAYLTGQELFLTGGMHPLIRG